MDGREFGGRNKGSVKSVINFYGERNNNTQMNFSEKSPSRAKELLLAKRDVSRYKDGRRAADSTKYKAETELLEARNTMENLSTLIEESNSNVKAQAQGLEKLRRLARNDERTSWVRNGEKYQYDEVARELEFVKQELSRLKLNMASVLDEKRRAEAEIEVSNSKRWSYSSSAVALQKEIEEVCEEQVLVELAQMEAMKEYAEIKDQRLKEADQYSIMIAQTKGKIEDMKEELEQSKELEGKLAVTLSDVSLFQNELNLVKEMDRRITAVSHGNSQNDTPKNEEVELMDASKLLDSVTQELEAAKKELASVKEEGFQFMSSMDIIRNELKHVQEERARLKKTEEKTNMTVQNLNSKLLRAKMKLESATAAEEKAKEIVSNLLLTLEQLKTEAEAAKKENKLVNEEISTIKAEIQKTDGEIDSSEERLQAAMVELEAVRASEAMALENLKTLIESTVSDRAAAYQNRTYMTISKFEYDYLRGRAAAAEEVADKKVAAAQVWIEALKASEREILMKTEIAQREVREMRMEEEQQVYGTERSLSLKRRVEVELKNRRPRRGKNSEADNIQLGFPGKSARKTMREKGSFFPAVRVKLGRSSPSPANRYVARSTSVNLKTKK